MVGEQLDELHLVALEGVIYLHVGLGGFLHISIAHHIDEDLDIAGKALADERILSRGRWRGGQNHNNT